jgi:hypothetical protein
MIARHPYVTSIRAVAVRDVLDAEGELLRQQAGDAAAGAGDTDAEGAQRPRWWPSHAAMEAPDSFLCPVTHDLMEEPVVTSDGMTYEREAIEEWLRDHDISPLTGERLAHTQLTPNLVLRSLIQEYREAQG